MSPSPVRRGAWRIHKRLSESDRWLDEMGFFRKHTARDPSCLFRIISENIYNTQRYFHQVRMNCIQFMASKRDLFEGSLNCPFESYLKGISNPSEWGGIVEISAMSHLYRRDFVIFEVNKGPQTKVCNGYGHTIYLFYSPDTKHFDAVYTKEFINSSSFCQSLVYELLYDGVFQIKDLSYAVNKMLYDKIPTNHVEYFMSENVERRKKQKERAKIFIEATSNDKDKNNNALALKCKHHTKDIEHASILKESLSIFILNRSLVQFDNICLNCLNINSAKDLLDNGITPFPYKVAKALDPDIYRNIEFDVWSEIRRELRYAGRYSDGKTLQVGVKCLCKLHSDQVVPYHCHIQEMRADGGPCLVFIEELGEKHIVNFEQLEPLPSDEIRPWAPPYRYSRAHSNLLTLSQMLQQIGNVTRKQGSNKSRYKTKNYSDDIKSAEKVNNGSKQIEKWNGEEIRDLQRYVPSHIDFHQHTDFFNFYTVPVEVETLPAMVDCRGGSGAASGDSSPATNGAAQEHNIQPRYTGNSSGEMAPPAASAAPPATTQPTTTTNTYGNPYSGNHYHQHHTSRPYTSGSMTTGAGGVGTVTGYGGCTYVPYTYKPGGVVWYAPNSPPPSLPPHAVAPIYKPNGPEMMNGDGRMHNGIASPPSQMPPVPYSPYAHPPPPPGMGCPPIPMGAPPGVNPFIYKSMQPNGTDLPFNDIMSLRFFFNLGLDCFHGIHWNSPAARHFSSRDLAQDMQQMCLYDRTNNGEQKHGKPGDKNNNNQGKGNGQRPPVGPRFKRTNNQDGQNNNHHQYNRQNNGNRGLNNNNRRNSSQSDTWSAHGGAPAGVMGAPTGQFPAEGEQPPAGVEQAPVHYVPYPPPPMYQIPTYYSIDQDPSVMMMGGVNYVNYVNEEGVEYPSVAPLQYYMPHPSCPPPTHYVPSGSAPAQAPAPAAPAPAPATAPAAPAAPNSAQNHHSENK